MAYVIKHELDYGDLGFVKNICVRTQKREGLSERYWRARKWLDAEVQRLDEQRCQQTREVAARLGLRLVT